MQEPLENEDIGKGCINVGIYGEIWGGGWGLKFWAIVLYIPEVEDSKRDLEDVLRFLVVLRQPPIGWRPCEDIYSLDRG